MSTGKMHIFIKKITTAVAVAFWTVTRERNHAFKLLYNFRKASIAEPRNVFTAASVATT